MVNQEFNLARGRPDPTVLIKDLTQPETGAGSATRGMPRPPSVAIDRIQFSPTTGGLRKSRKQSIALDDPQQSELAACPSELFLG